MPEIKGPAPPNSDADFRQGGGLQKKRVGGEGKEEEVEGRRKRRRNKKKKKETIWASQGASFMWFWGFVVVYILRDSLGLFVYLGCV